MAQSKIRPLTLDMISERVKLSFWDRVSGAFEEGDRCWEWIGTYHPRSKKEAYPARPVLHITIKQKKFHFLAYRVAYLLHHGKIPRKIIRHICNNERCCNPAHLRASTQSRNIKDHFARLRGERSCKSPECCNGTEHMEAS